jgi:DNA polymerase I-like protein with 3'-5' exonuclease and polymerase domains
MSRLSTGSGAPVVARVYDIANCGPRNRFAANGKLVHNSGGEGLNLQNLPKRGGDKTLRKAMCAPKGYKIIGCDSAQIEARIVAAVAGETDLVAAFRDKRDVYSEFASMVFGRTVTKETDELARHVGKTAVLGLGYGMGAEKFQMTLKMGHPSVDLDLDECQRIVKMYRSKYSMINSLWNRCGNALNRMIADDPGHIHLAVAFDKEGFILPNGLRIQYPGLHPTNSGFAYYSNSRDYAKHLKGDEAKVTYLYGAKAVENVVQGLAALVIREQMVAAHQAGLKVVLQVHDEIVIVAPESEAEAALKTLQTIMSAPPAWMPALPLACEGKIADNYGGV